MRKSLACLACILPVLTACANQVALIEEQSEQRVTLLATDRVVIELPELRRSDARLEGLLAVERDLTERVERVTTRRQERVPWRAERELYEVPLGLLGLPLVPFAEGVDLLLGGSRPGRFASLAVAGLNPALNAEWAPTIERRTLDTRTEVVGFQPRKALQPLAARTLLISFDGGAPVVVQTDGDGRFSVQLLAVARASRARAMRSLRVRASGPERVERRANVDRALARRLQRALDLVLLLEKPSASAENLAAAVHQVDRLGFPDYAQQFEEEVRQRFADDRVYVDFFRRSLARRQGSRSVPANAD